MSAFAQEFLEEMKPVALARIKGGLFRRLSRVWQMGLANRYRSVHVADNRGTGLRYSRAVYFSAVYDAGERMSPEEQSAWRADGTLPDGFWEWVEARAASWDSLSG